MVASCRGILLIDGFKVPCVRGTGELGDVRWLGVPDVVPVHGLEERMLLEVRDSIPAQPHLRVTDQPVGNERRVDKEALYLDSTIFLDGCLFLSGVPSFDLACKQS